MQSEPRGRVKKLFDDALELSADTRRSFLAERCQDDSSLLAEVEKLLEQHEQTARLLQGDEDLTATVKLSELVLGGRYRIDREIGQGGFGRVYLARDQQLENRPVVIKTLLEHRKNDTWLEKKFSDEVKALARIDHPGVVGALDQGKFPDGTPFLVMQYVEGVTLRSEIARRALTLPRIARIVRQVGQALSAAHEKGVWHLDLKPENIMLQQGPGGEEFVKLIDFGIANVHSPDDTFSKTASRITGSLAYMAPEQFEGKPSAASDIYAFGLISYEMLTGQKPFGSRPMLELVNVQRQESMPRPRELNLALPAQVEEVLLQALRYSPRERFARAREFGQALADVLESAREQERARAAPAFTMLEPRAPHRLKWLAAAGVATALCAGVAFLAYQNGLFIRPGSNPPSVPVTVSQETSKTEPVVVVPLEGSRPTDAVPGGDSIAVAKTEPPPLPPEFPTNSNWRDQAEHDLYDAIVKETNPKSRLEKLEQWQQQYPGTDFLKERRSLQLTTYAALGRAPEAAALAQQILAEEPKNFAALYYTMYFTRQLAGSLPASDVLERGEKAASAIMSNLDVPPPNMREEQWKSARSGVENLAHTTLGWIAVQRKNWETVEAEFQRSLQIDPNNGEADYWIGVAIVYGGKPEQQSRALFYLARAAAYEGPGSMTADRRNQVLAYVQRQYKNFHGSDAGFSDLLKQATTQPPPDFKIKNAREVAEETERRSYVASSVPTTAPAETSAEDASALHPDAPAPVAAKTTNSRTGPLPDIRSTLARGLSFYNAKNYIAAFPLLRQAADAGNSTGMRGVGMIYQNGWGVSKDYGEAMKWFRKAADAGDGAGMADIGQLYLNGYGVAKDYGEAMKWSRKGAEAGSAFGMWKIGLLYENGWGVHKDLSEAMKWFRKAADAGEELAMWNIGLLYQNGRGVHRDPNEAMRWYQKAAAAGSSDAMRNIGFLYEYGWGVRKDYAEAMRWYRKAGEAGNSTALRFIGKLYEHGSGVKKDKDEAISWYRKSAEAGNKPAEDDLRRLHAER
jgi:TPR repeat protein/serine/threonine protein kinase